MKLSKQHAGLLAAAVVGTTMAYTANAALSELSISYDTGFTGFITGGGANNEDVYLTAFSALQIGGDSLPYPTSNPFTTFCLDIAPDLIPTDWWKSETFDQAGVGNEVSYVAGGIQRAASLYGAYVGGVNFTTPQGEINGAALQLAIWHVLYNSDNSPSSSVTSGAGFSVSGADPTVTALADSMLHSAANFANPNLTSTFWNATDSSGNAIFNQDLIGPQMETGFGSVPEPGTYMAAAAACVSVCFSGLRRHNRG